MNLANRVLTGLTEEQKKEVKHIQDMGEWLVLFAKGISSKKGLNKKDKTRIKILTNKLLANKDAQRSRS